MDKTTATTLATKHGIDLAADFHALDSAQVLRIVAAADERQYRKPRGANGSRARYFHAALVRAAARRA